ncbi:hypothetical protein AB6A40_004309 [Gnathostoma spinigerum]|uniref:Adenylosuccinate synthetase n=1 Tax=Gnathostoma spinigerum TaxID=75299 RepID=A0ABD6EC44_9BILA
MVPQVNKAPVTVLLGAQWGDEGKGKVIDFLISNRKVHVTARCAGGNNAGHTVVVNGAKYDFHILPSGIIDDQCFNIIGNGVVLNLDSFFDELEHNKVLNQPGWEKRLMISELAHLVFSIHTVVDGQQEDILSHSKLGTTKRGIGPTYSSKCFRNGIRVCDLLGDFDEFSRKYHSLVELYRKQFPSVNVDIDGELCRFKQHAAVLKELNIVGDAVSCLDDMRTKGNAILVEGANGTMLDIDFGTYPYVTSSNATVGGAITGLGLPPSSIKEVIGVAKAYLTRVGSGPFPTELKNDIGDQLQQIGKEVGVTTGRKRRCGWLDLFLLKRANTINGFTGLALTKLDVLDSFATIKVAVGYKLNGVCLNAPPSRISDWNEVQVQYSEFPGWKTNISGVRNYAELPENCRKYVEFIEEYVGVPIKWIGVGEDRGSLIVR